MVGRRVGLNVGFLVGAFAGIGVGVLVGSPFGNLVGDFVGPLGAFVGVLVFFSLGLLDHGTLVEAFVGVWCCKLGFLLGNWALGKSVDKDS